MQAEHWLILANLLLVFFLKLTCFALGYLVVRLGANLLREGVKGEFKFSAGLAGPKADLKSASPGLLFLALGVALIAYAMYVSKVITIESDTPTQSPYSPIPEVSNSDQKVAPK